MEWFPPAPKAVRWTHRSNPQTTEVEKERPTALEEIEPSNGRQMRRAGGYVRARHSSWTQKSPSGYSSGKRCETSAPFFLSFKKSGEGQFKGGTAR